MPISQRLVKQTVIHLQARMCYSIFQRKKIYATILGSLRAQHIDGEKASTYQWKPFMIPFTRTYKAKLQILCT